MTVLDTESLLRVLRPARMEMGMREYVRLAPDTLRFKVGMSHATALVTVTANTHDLFDVKFLKVRGLKTTELGSMTDVFVGDLDRLLTGKWCEICEEKGW